MKFHWLFEAVLVLGFVLSVQINGDTYHYRVIRRICPSGFYHDPITDRCQRVPGGGNLIKFNLDAKCSGRFQGLLAHSRQSRYYFVCQKNAVLTCMCNSMDHFNRILLRCERKRKQERRKEEKTSEFVVQNILDKYQCVHDDQSDDDSILGIHNYQEQVTENAKTLSPSSLTPSWHFYGPFYTEHPTTEQSAEVATYNPISHFENLLNQLRNFQSILNNIDKTSEFQETSTVKSEEIKTTSTIQTTNWPKKFDVTFPRFKIFPENTNESPKIKDESQRNSQESTNEESQPVIVDRVLDSFVMRSDNDDDNSTTISPISPQTMSPFDRILDKFKRRKNSNITGDFYAGKMTIEELKKKFPGHFKRNKTFDYDFDDPELKMELRKKFIEYYDVFQYYYEDSPNETLFEVEGSTTEIFESTTVDTETTTEKVGSHESPRGDMKVENLMRSEKDGSLENLESVETTTATVTTTTEFESTFSFPKAENLVTLKMYHESEHTTDLTTNKGLLTAGKDETTITTESDRNIQKKFESSTEISTIIDQTTEVLTSKISSVEGFQNRLEGPKGENTEISTDSIFSTTNQPSFFTTTYEEPTINRKQIEMTTGKSTEPSTAFQQTTSTDFTESSTLNFIDFSTTEISNENKLLGNTNIVQTTEETSTLPSQNFKETSTILETSTDEKPTTKSFASTQQDLTTEVEEESSTLESTTETSTMIGVDSSELFNSQVTTDATTQTILSTESFSTNIEQSTTETTETMLTTDQTETSTFTKPTTWFDFTAVAEVSTRDIMTETTENFQILPSTTEVVVTSTKIIVTTENFSVDDFPNLPTDITQTLSTTEQVLNESTQISTIENISKVTDLVDSETTLGITTTDTSTTGEGTADTQSMDSTITDKQTMDTTITDTQTMDATTRDTQTMNTTTTDTQITGERTTATQTMDTMTTDTSIAGEGITDTQKIETTTTDTQTIDTTKTDTQTMDTTTIDTQTTDIRTKTPETSIATLKPSINQIPAFLSRSDDPSDLLYVQPHKEIEYYYEYEDYEVDENDIPILQTNITKTANTENNKTSHKLRRDNSFEYYVESISASREFRDNFT